MKYNVYSLTTAAPSHLAGFNSYESANEWASDIRKAYLNDVPIFVVEGTITLVTWGSKK